MFADPNANVVTMGSPRRSSEPNGESPPPVLIVPGLDNSCPRHWQSHWQRVLPSAVRVDQADWTRPSLEAWRFNLARAVAARPGAILVAHSLGCALVAHLAQSGECAIAGALLVAPADVDNVDLAGGRLRSFAPMPRRRLPFPSLVAASRNDPFVDFEQARAFAHAWGSSLVDLGDAGHVNVAAGCGAWTQGLTLLDDVMARMREGPQLDLAQRPAETVHRA